MDQAAICVMHLSYSEQYPRPPVQYGALISLFSMRMTNNLQTTDRVSKNFLRVLVSPESPDVE